MRQGGIAVVLLSIIALLFTGAVILTPHQNCLLGINATLEGKNLQCFQDVTSGQWRIVNVIEIGTDGKLFVLDRPFWWR